MSTEPPDPTLARLGTTVRRLRTDRSLTLRQLAERAQLSPRFMSQLEAGRANIAVGRLARVADALQVTLPALFDDPERTPAAHALYEHLRQLLAGRSEDELRRCLDAFEDTLGHSHHPTIALLGLRGAGKSFLGRQLADALSLPFVELDRRIEDAAGLGLPELFALHGENYYRRLETQSLQALLTEPPCVVALGGGVVHNPDAFDLVRRRCTTVWLKADPEDHMARVLAQGDRRPMAGNPNAMVELRRILHDREPLYRLADLTIDTSHLADQALPTLLAQLPHT